MIVNDLPPVEFDHGTNVDDRPLDWERRVFAVGLAWAIPGFVFGCLLGLVLPPEYLLAGEVAGGLVGFAAGGLLEANYWG
jgi:hypothetical protein